MANRFYIAAPIIALVGAGLFTFQLTGRGNPSNENGLSPGKNMQQGPVVVELFTSEGCSSCPPADALLRRLEATSMIDGTEIIVLGAHVDYWNRLGWADRFSSRQFSARQEDYSESVGSGQVYTPQMIVDGRDEFNGSDERRALRAISKAARLSKIKVSVDLIKSADVYTSRIKVDELPAPARSAKVILILTESNLQSEVRSGENSGRRLQHAAVVRALGPLGEDYSGKSFSVDVPLQFEKDWKKANLKVVLVQASNQQVLGAASSRLP